MTKISNRLARSLMLGAALMVSLITSPPAQIASLGVVTLALTAGQAMAQTVIPGVGQVVKKKPGNSPIAKGVSDDNGMFEHKGLEPGEYSVCFADDRGKGESCADVKVGKNGTIRAQTLFDEKRKAANPEYTGHVILLR